MKIIFSIQTFKNYEKKHKGKKITHECHHSKMFTFNILSVVVFFKDIVYSFLNRGWEVTGWCLILFFLAR